MEEEVNGIQSGVLGESDKITQLGLGSKFAMIKGTETIKAKKRYSIQSD